jgi:NTE family protein
MLLQTFAIMGQSINGWSLPQADLVITPNLQGVSGTDFGAREKAIQAGYLATKAALPALLALVQPQFPTGTPPHTASTATPQR